MRHRLFASAPSPSLFLRCVAYGSARAFVSRPFQDGVNERAHRDTGRRADAFDENASGGLDRGRDLEAGQRKSKHVRSGTTQAKERRQGQGRNVRSPSRLSLSLSLARALLDAVLLTAGVSTVLSSSQASGLDCTEVVDLTAASPSRSKKAVPDIEIVRTKIVKKPRAQPRVNQVQRPRGVGQAILTGLTTMASVLPRMQNTVRSAPPPPEPNPPTTSNGLECRICIDSLKQPAATPCG